MTDSLMCGMVIWAGEIIATGWLGWRLWRSRERFPALFAFLLLSPLLQLALIPLFLRYRLVWYGPYWSGVNAYGAVETFLFVCILADLAGASRKGVIVGAVMALGASAGIGEAQTLIAIMLTLISALAAFMLDEPEANIAQGVLVQVAIPLIAAIKPEAEWLRWAPTVTAWLGLALWAYATRVVDKPRARALGAGA